jgi:probable F420-dependent oxidoreductase
MTVYVDASLAGPLEGIAEAARAREADGYDGVWVGETNHDPFLQALKAAEGTSSVVVGTSIAIAFARTPMTLASTAFDLGRLSQGRFVLGLGSQVKPHIERRFSMPWSHPALRMHELVRAIRAIWDCWQNGATLDFRGEFYTHTLMTPMFSPAALEVALPRIFLAGVGTTMTEVAGEVADGYFAHAFTTERYLREVTLPALQRGAERAGQSDLSHLQICVPSFVVVGRSDEELDRAIKGTKKQIAFYASTPSYRAVLDLHGFGDLQPELTRLSKVGGWDQMTDLISDEVLHEFAVVGTPAEVADGVLQKYQGAADRVSFYGAYDHAADVTPELIAAVKQRRAGPP